MFDVPKAQACHQSYDSPQAFLDLRIFLTIAKLQS